MFRAVNVGEFPDLREPALSGALHRLDDGEPVDVPFVYHDPEARQFALVVPEGARGRELSERARLLDLLMGEDEGEVPDYVRHFSVVYGCDGLRRYVDDARTMEVEVHELEPVDEPPAVASYFPRLAGLLPEAGFSRHAETELATLLDDDELWVFARVAEAEEDAFAESSSDLLIQLKTVEQIPVCILSLIDMRTHAVRRAFLNPVRSADGLILERLRRDFHATVVVLDEARRLLRSFRLEAPRAANAQLIVDRVEHAPSCSKEGWALALAACRATPPPVDTGGHPFAIQDEALTAGEALQRLRELEAWSLPGRTEEAMLIKSVPKNVVELAQRRVAIDAARFGLAMSDALVLRAVRFGLAPDAKTLVQSLARRFEEIVPQASENGLEESEVEANRGRLRRLSQVHGTSTGTDLSCTMEHSG